MKRFFLKLLLLVIIFGAGAFVGKFYLSQSKENFDLTVLKSQINEIAELATLEEEYTAQETYKGDARELWGIEIPFSSKEMILNFSGTIKAGPDMAKADIKAGTDGRSIKITLPHSEILSHEIDESSIQIVSIKNGLFNRVTPENTNEIRKDAKEKKEAELKKSDFLDRADKKAVQQIQSFLETAYPNSSIEVKVSDK